MKARFMLGVALLLIGVVSTLGLRQIVEAQEAETPHYKVYNFREWYLQSLWQIHQQTPDSAVLLILYDLTDTYIGNFVIPNTGEDLQTAKARIVSALGPNPSDLEVHTAVTIESYTAGSCSGGGTINVSF